MGSARRRKKSRYNVKRKRRYKNVVDENEEPTTVADSNVNVSNDVVVDDVIEGDSPANQSTPPVNNVVDDFNIFINSSVLLRYKPPHHVILAPIILLNFTLMYYCSTRSNLEKSPCFEKNGHRGNQP